MPLKRRRRGKISKAETETADTGNEIILVYGQDNSLMESHQVRREGNTWSAADIGYSFPLYLRPVPMYQLMRIGRAPAARGRRIILALTDPPSPDADDAWVMKTLPAIRRQSEEGQRVDQKKRNSGDIAAVAAVVIGLCIAIIGALTRMEGAGTGITSLFGGR